MTQVLIGRRQVQFEQFVDAVKASKRYTEVCDRLGFNSTVATTKQAIKDKIEELQLDTTHFEYKYTKGDKWAESAQNRVKAFDINPINQEYYNSFENKFEGKPTSWLTYKVQAGGFLETLGNKDFATVSIEEIESYTGNKENAKAHLRSMMIHVIKENINNAVDKVSKEMLIWLI